MPDAAAVNRSVNTIRTELEFLRDSGVLVPPQFHSIMSQLPQPGGAPSQYIDPGCGGQYAPQAIAQSAQDPNSPAHPQNKGHHEWVQKFGSKFGNAAIWGAGATAGGDLVNSILR